MTAKRPETLRMAQTTDRHSRQARAEGLCVRCAPLNAFGRRDGFLSVAAPCDVCVVVMSTWPGGAVAGWKRPPSRSLSTPVALALPVAPDVALDVLNNLEDAA